MIYPTTPGTLKIARALHRHTVKTRGPLARGVARSFKDLTPAQQNHWVGMAWAALRAADRLLPAHGNRV